MTNELIFKLEFDGANGEKVPVQLTADGIRTLIAQLLDLAASVKLPPSLDRTIALIDSPAPVNGLMIAPLEGDPTAAHLSLGVGPIDVQFAVLLPVLMGALEALKQKTEPDPDSSRLN